MIEIESFLRNHERAVGVITSILLIASNLGSLYFIIDLLSYDEMVGYHSDGGSKSSDPHDFVYGLLITVMLNLVFALAVLCSWLTQSE